MHANSVELMKFYLKKSYLHRNVTMRFLTCEPNLATPMDSYVDEADQFYADPDDWFRKNWSDIENVTRLVIYENLYVKLESSKFIRLFTHCEKIFNSPVRPTERVDKYMYICSRLNGSTTATWLHSEL